MDPTDDVSRKRAKLERCPPGHKDRGVAHTNLARALNDRLQKEGDISDIEEAITLRRAALELRPPGHPRRGEYLNNLACSLISRFQKQPAMGDLEEAIELFRAALILHPPGHPDRCSSLHNLACCLSNRYDNQGLVADLEEVVTLARAALDLCPLGDPNRGISINSLAGGLVKRFQKHALMHDLEEAIELYYAALELCLSRHPIRSSLLHNLAFCLSVRHVNQGAVTDLEEAVTLGRAALDLHPPGSPDRDILPSSLACDLRRRFQKQAEMRDLEKATKLHRAALELRPSGHPDRSSSLHSLSLCFLGRYDQQPVAADLDVAIALEQEALHSLIPGDPHYDISRRCLAAYLQMKIRIGSQGTMTIANASPDTHFDVMEAIRNVALDTLKTMPIRLLHTHTGNLCNRSAQIASFMSSQQYSQLVSLCATCDVDQRMELIRTTVRKYFQYVMLSHRWGEDEPLLHDIEGHPIYGMRTNRGFGKLQTFCAVACELDYLWAWSDTCCIDKHSSAELQEVIGSVFAWYRRSALTIVYLADVFDTGSLESSEWFRRAWTLQELLAPRSILFYTQNWSPYKNLASSNHKADIVVLGELERATGIESRFLTDFSPGMEDARSRLQWASWRRSARPEDIAYALFGIFDLHLPVLYGESAEKALGRLLAEIISQSGDISVLDWVGEASPFHSCFPAHITSYQPLPLPPPQPDAEEHTLKVIQQPAPSLTALQTLYRSLAELPLPLFDNRRLILPCIAHDVTAIQLKTADPHAPSYTYEMQASGLRPLQIILPRELENVTTLPGVLQIIRPWDRKLLGSPTVLHDTAEERLLFTLGRPFNALLLTKVPYNEYKRITSSTLITAQPIDTGSILHSEVKVLEIV